MKRIVCLVFIVIFFAPIQSLVFAQDTRTTTLTPSADATIVEGDASTHGSSPALICENDQKSFLIKFDLGVIPSDSIVQSATLELTQTAVSGDDISISTYKVNSSWSETTVSGTNKPNLDKGVNYGLLSVDEVTGKKTFSQNFSDLVQLWLEDSSTNFGFYFEAANSASYMHEFGSRESVTKPTLTISYLTPDTEGPIITNIDISGITSLSAEISWNTNEEATSFVDYGESGSFGRVMGSDEMTTDHAVIIRGLESNATYYFRIRSSDVSENESASDTMTFRTLSDSEGELPQKSEEVVSDEIAPPSDLKVTGGREDGSYYVELTWEYSYESEIDGCRIYKSEGDNISYVLLTEVGAERTFFKDEDVEEGKTYYYVVRAVEGEDESEDSNEEVVTIYKSSLEESLHNINFWKGFIVFNVVVLPVFVFLYLRYRKKSRNLKLLGGKRKGKKRK